MKMGAPKKGTPEYDAWRNSPEYDAWIKKIKASHQSKAFRERMRETKLGDKNPRALRPEEIEDRLNAIRAGILKGLTTVDMEELLGLSSATIRDFINRFGTDEDRALLDANALKKQRQGLKRVRGRRFVGDGEAELALALQSLS